MQLSKLEAKGFKSFGEKITIYFENGITGIVGPNGCGKSNVVDAIRWVLGEQKTRNLRSEKMEDVIFNGTKDRKPQQMAEVSITFNNTRNLLPTEYAQVTITRRYYRTGDSEYEINGVQCRLKDINNLFLDTGIGSDSYAIIELKMVEDLLNDRDGSRRELFEEAAGVSKFKIRKKQTLRKLEDTEKDLARVEDLLFEIDKNLKSLEKQAKQAEKYYELKNEYKSNSIQLAHASMANQAFEMTSLLTHFNTENDKKATYTSQIAVAEAEIEKIKIANIKQEIKLKEAQNQLNTHIGKIRNYESEKNIKNERLKYLADTQDRISKQLQVDKEQKDKSEILLKSISQEMSGLQKQLDEQELRVSTLKSDSEMQKEKANRLQNQYLELNTQIKTRQELVFSLNKSLEINAFQITTLKQELEKTTVDGNTQSTDLQLFEGKLKDLSQLLAEKQMELDKLEKNEKANIDIIASLDTSIVSLKDRIADTNRKSDAKQNEFNLTKSLVENLEGFPEAVRFLKKNANWVKEVPLLSDVITCDEKYRIAVENYLEPLMNYYVVDTDQDALKAINLLNNATMGKANFFILKSFQNYKSNAISIAANKVSAISIMEFDTKYEQLVRYLLDNVYIITDNNEDFAEGENQIAITINGKIIKKKYSISGGSVGLFEGKRIGRAKNLEILEKEIKVFNSLLSELKTELENKQKQLENRKSLSQKQTIDLLQKEYNLVQQDQTAYATRKEQLANILDKNLGRKDEILDKIDSLRAEIEKAEPAAKQAQIELKSLEERVFDLQSETDEEGKLAAQKLAVYNEENIKLFQTKNRFNSLQQEFEYKENNQESTLKRISQAVAELSRTEADIKLMLEKSEVNDVELSQMYEIKEKLEFELNETEKSYYNTRGEVDKTEKMTRELQRQREIADTLLAEINNKLNEGKLKLSSIKERLSLEFNIDSDSLIAEAPPEITFTENELKTKIDQLKNAMERLGQINPMAMEAYQEIKERHDLISEQKNDIVSAKNSLLDTISEIDNTAKATFLHTFGEIKENFKIVFRSLFTEDDSCDVILADPNDPLESDIDIIAKPKGKRPQSINQLSGG
ncbi:MAG: chromosome segregation protein SMC, partial [Cytophagales bacterium]